MAYINGILIGFTSVMKKICRAKDEMKEQNLTINQDRERRASTIKTWEITILI